MWILGNPIRIEGVEYSSERAIYISNHASLIDPLLLMYLTPICTLFFAARAIIWYPLFGQVYFLANYLRIDWSSPTSTIKSMKEGSIGAASEQDKISTRKPDKSKVPRATEEEPSLVAAAVASGS